MSGSTASKGFAITISAQDAASKQIDAINRKLKEMQAPAERLTKSFSKLAETSGITALSHGMREVADSSFRAFENLGRMVAPLGLITGAASIAGLSRLVTGFADLGTALVLAGQRARISAGDLAAYQGAATLALSSSEAMTAGVTALADSMFHALQGTAPEAVIAFNKLHIEMADLVNGDGSLKQALRKSCRRSFKVCTISRSNFLRADRYDVVQRRRGGPGAGLPAQRETAQGVHRAGEGARLDNRRAG